MNEILDVETIDKASKEASKGKRLANNLIDGLGQMMITFLFTAISTFIRNPETAISSLNNELISTDNTILDYVFGILLTIFYYILFEYQNHGVTLGKLVTKTRAVTVDNKYMDLQTTIKRTLIRLIPFEALSFLGAKPNGWHDRWSKTKVVEDVDWLKA